MSAFVRKLIRSIASLPTNIVNALYGYDIFISYAHDDGEAYPTVLDDLLRGSPYNYITHLDTRDYHAGKNLNRLTRLRVRNSRLLVVVGRPKALEVSRWVQREVLEFEATNRSPIIIDVDDAVASSINAPAKDTLSEWIADRKRESAGLDPMIRINDNTAEGETAPGAADRLPSADVAKEVSARFTGDRVEARRLRVVRGTMLLLCVLVLGVAYAGLRAYLSSERALAESWANEALVAVTGTDLNDGFLLDGVNHAVDALLKQPTTNVMSVAAKLEGRLPTGIVYANRSFEPLTRLSPGGEVIYVREGNHTVHALRPSDLTIVDSWDRKTLGLNGLGHVMAQPDSFIALSSSKAVHIKDGVTRQFPVLHWESAPRPAGGFAIRYGSGEVALYDAVGNPAAFPCEPPDLSVSWLGFLDNNRLMLGGHGRGKHRLMRLSLDSCEVKESILGEQVLNGAIVSGQHLVISGPKSVSVYDDSLSRVDLAFAERVTAIAATRVAGSGFAIGNSNGQVTLHTLNPAGRIMHRDTVDKVIPGTVEALSFDAKSENLVVAGKRGFFVDAKLTGALVSVPLAQTRNRELVFDVQPPASTLREFTPTEEIQFARASTNGFLLGGKDGNVNFVTFDGELSSVDFGVAGSDITLTAIATFEDTHYAGYKTDGGGLVVGRRADGQMLRYEQLPGMPTKLTAHPAGVYALFENDPRSLRNGVVINKMHNILQSGEASVFEVEQLNTNQVHATLTVDPTGRTLALARFDGFEFRDVVAAERPSNCVVRLDEKGERAGVAAAFAPDGNTVVLGSWGGLLSIWERQGNCWALRQPFETGVGRMIPTLAFDGKMVVGRSLSSPARLRRWDAETGSEIGSGYNVNAIAMHVTSAGQTALWGRMLEPLLARQIPRDSVVTFASSGQVGKLDLSVDATVARLCSVLSPALTSGLISGFEQHACINSLRDRGGTSQFME